MSERLVRVFVSSTFRDFQAERDFLVNRVFPELRSRCRKRGVEFIEIDLRWGITAEQFERGEVLRICLSEVDRCRPYFIGLLGGRYGWIPREIDAVSQSEYPWLDELAGRSITELEIVHGVLRDPAAHGRSVFYFRDPSYVANPGEDDPKVYLSSGPAEEMKLAQLKDAIRHTGVHVRENYNDTDALGVWVLEDLWSLIQRDFPDQNRPTPWELEAGEHEAYAQSRRGVYIGRDEYFIELDDAAMEDGPPLVVTGESGSGKSALLSNWMVHTVARHSDVAAFLHHVGANADSADFHHLVRRLAEWLRGRGLMIEALPADPGQLVNRMPALLRSAAEKMRLIIVLDGLDRLDDRPGALDLDWLANWATDRVSVILSALPSQPLESASRRGWRFLEIKLLEPRERATMIGEYLLRFSKRLPPSLAERIASAEQAANPLHLKLLLGELRVFGRHEELSKAVDHFLVPRTIAGLYELVLARMERDFDSPSLPLVGRVMTLLWSARRGLSETELAQLLGSVDEPLPRRHWSPLFLGLEESVINRGGFLSFSHDYLRQAVERRYLISDNAKQMAHQALAEVALDWRNPGNAPSLTEYALQHGTAHLQACARLEELWSLVMDEAFITAQIAAFDDCIATFDGFRRLLEMLGRHEPRSTEQDVRLVTAALKAAALSHLSSRQIEDAFSRLRMSSLDDPGRLPAFTERLASLDDRGRYDAALVGLWIETRRQLVRDGAPDAWATMELCKWVRGSVSTDVDAVNWAPDLSTLLVKNLCTDLLRLLPPNEVADLITRAAFDRNGGGLFPLVDLMAGTDPEKSGIAPECVADFVLAVDEIGNRVPPCVTVRKTDRRCRIRHAAIQMLARVGNVPRAVEIARTLEPAAQVVMALRSIAVAVAAAGDPTRALDVAGMILQEAAHARALAEIAGALWRNGHPAEARDILQQASECVNALEPGWLTTDARESLVETLADCGRFADAFAELDRIDREVTQRDALIRIGENLVLHPTSGESEWVAAFDAMMRLSALHNQTLVAAGFSEILASTGDLARLETLASFGAHLFDQAQAFAACHARRGDSPAFSKTLHGLGAKLSFAVLLAKGGCGSDALRHAGEISDETERVRAFADLAEEFTQQEAPELATLAWKDLNDFSAVLMTRPIGSEAPSQEWKRAHAVVTATVCLVQSRRINPSDTTWQTIICWLAQFPEAYFEDGYYYSAYKHLARLAGQVAESGAIDAAIRILELAPGKYRPNSSYGTFIESKPQGSDIESAFARESALVETARGLCAQGRGDIAARLADVVEGDHALVPICASTGCAAFARGDFSTAQALWQRGIARAAGRELYGEVFFNEFQTAPALLKAGKCIPNDSSYMVGKWIERLLDVGEAKACLPLLHKIKNTREAPIASLVWAKLGDFTKARSAGYYHIGSVPLPLDRDFDAYVQPQDIEKFPYLWIRAVAHGARRFERKGASVEAQEAWNQIRDFANSTRERIVRERYLELMAKLLAETGRWEEALQICPNPDARESWSVTLTVDALARGDFPQVQCLLAGLEIGTLSIESARRLAEGYTKIGETTRAEGFLRHAFANAITVQTVSVYELGDLARAAVGAGFPSLVHDYAIRANLTVPDWEALLTRYWEALAPCGRDSLRWMRLSFEYAPFTPRLAFYGARMFCAALVRAGELQTFEKIATGSTELGMESLFLNSTESPMLPAQSRGFAALWKWLR